MKTALFGYSKKEANEELETIVKKNSRLQSEVEELKNQLYNAQNEKSDEDWEAEVHGLESKLLDAENENALLRNELKALKAEMGKAQSEYNADDIGAMYQEAYGDVMKMKISAKEHMTEIISDFMNNWETAYKKMEAVIDKNAFMRKNARESFSKSVAEIMQSFDEMEALSDKLCSGLSKTKAEKDRIKSLLEQPVNEVFKGNTKEQE